MVRDGAFQQQAGESATQWLPEATRKVGSKAVTAAGPLASESIAARRILVTTRIGVFQSRIHSSEASSFKFYNYVIHKFYGRGESRFQETKPGRDQCLGKRTGCSGDSSLLLRPNPKPSAPAAPPLGAILGPLRNEGAEQANRGLCRPARASNSHWTKHSELSCS